MIEFRPRGAKALTAVKSTNEAQRSTDMACASPIVVKRWGNDDNVISISFHIGFFTVEIVEIALKGLVYGEESIWQLRKLDREQNSVYAEYLLVLLKNFGEQREETLNAIIGRIVKEVYLEEMHFWNDDIKVADLAKPHSYELSDGANIGNKTTNALLSANITTTGDLTKMSRDDICRIPGMTTEEVVRLEKSLASRGLFLTTKIPSRE